MTCEDTVPRQTTIMYKKWKEKQAARDNVQRAARDLANHTC